MPDLTSAIQQLDKIQYVLGIRYSTLRASCVIRVLKNSTKVRAQIHEVLKRYSTAYVVELVPRSKEYIEAVIRMAAQGKASKPKRLDHLPAHTHRTAKKKAGMS